MVTASTQRENSSFYVAERTKGATKCATLKTASAKRAKLLLSLLIMHIHDAPSVDGKIRREIFAHFSHTFSNSTTAHEYDPF